MSADDIPALRRTIADMQQQLKAKEDDLDDLKHDKRYLRAHNEELKSEVSNLKAELQGSVSREAKLAERLRSVKMATKTPPEDSDIPVRPCSCSTLNDCNCSRLILHDC